MTNSAYSIVRRRNGYLFFFKQKTAYEIKECDWSSDVCSSDLTSDPFASIDTWYHVAIVRNGTTVTGYVDGIAVDKIGRAACRERV